MIPTPDPGLARRSLAALCLLALVLAAPAPTLPAALPQQSHPQWDSGAVGLAQMLGRLQTTASLLHTAAHPDDENTALLARLARGDHARVAYLSVTRGEGGQNALGPELGEALGVIRSEELLQARRLDGAAQFFTRAFDYGFSKRLEEALEFWGEREALGDMVRVIRTYRPLVIASQFSGTARDGHGQHQFSGHITPLAFRAAADPTQFPEHFAQGLRPWQPKKLFISGGFRPTAADQDLMPVEVGIYDPLLGRTYYEIAAQGRSQHRSQEMGTLQLRGPQTTRWRLAESTLDSADDAADAAMFAGLDVTLRGIERLTGMPSGVITQELAAMDEAVTQAVRDFHALDPPRILPHLARGLASTRAARARLASRLEESAAFAEADFLLAHKEAEFLAALELAAGLVLDALADSETVTPGGSLQVTVRLFAPDPATVTVEHYQLHLPAGWQVQEAAEGAAELPAQRFRRAELTPHERTYQVTVPADAPSTTPYFLQQPRAGYLYSWAGDPAATLPFAPPLLHAEVRARVAGIAITARRPVEFRFADDIRGELRPAVHVVPAVTLSLDPPLLMAPMAALDAPRVFTARACSHARRPLRGSVRLRLPAGWKATPESAALDLPARGACRTAQFQVTIPPGAAQGDYRIAAEAQAGDALYTQSMQLVTYPHIATHRLYAPAQADVHLLGLRVAPVRVGYVMGSGDQVPDAIRRMGLDLTLLDEQALATGDLSRFDTIVVGIKAANVRPDLIANNSRLLDFARQGGALIVQFQQSPWLENRMAPFPVAIDNFAPTRARVADETAPVVILQPAHPLFHFPNPITAADFDGWVQERSLYNLTQWAPEYTPLLESADPGEAPQRGGHVHARLGRGHFVYTSYSWFRQLPAGVPGAYRLFANLLSLPRAPQHDAPRPDAPR